MVVQLVGTAHFLGGLGRHAGDENGLLAVGQQYIQNAGDLLRSFPRPVNDLRHPLADFSVEVHLGVADVGKGLGLDFYQSVLHRQIAGVDRFQNSFDFVVHPRTSRSSSTAL